MLIAPTSSPISFEPTHWVDLGGKIFLPKFIDAHCHVLPTGLDLQKLTLGDCYSHAAVLEAVQQRHLAEPEGWLHAVHYEQSRFEGGTHLTRDDLDKISSSRPIFLRHVNGHASVANSAALLAAGVDDSTPDPNGGEFQRDAGGRLTGVLLETAHEIVTSKSPGPNFEDMVEAILAAGRSMAAYGIGTASDMMTGRFDLLMELEAYREAARRGCPVRTRLYLQWGAVFGGRGIGLDRLREEIAKFDQPEQTRVAGIKIFADGAIGSATAAIYGQYASETGKGPVISSRGKKISVAEDGRPVSGQLIYSKEKLFEMTRIATDAGFQVCVHAIGDYAVDLVLDAFEASGDPSRHRIEHAMILSDDQITRMASLGCFCTFQPEFLVRFGQAYLRQLGPEKTVGLKRARSIIDAGISLSFNSDRPIVSGDPWLGIEIALNRSGIFSESERVTLAEAIDAYTIRGAEVNGDSGQLGSLAVGEWADYQVLDAIPVSEVSN